MPPNPGWIELIYGCVKSGKSRTLIDKINSVKNAIDKEKFKKEFLVVKHPLDDRETKGKISSFDGGSIDAIECETPKDLVECITKYTKFIFLGGVHLFGRDIVPLLKALVDTNVIIVATGINLTSKGKPYNYIPQIMTVTDVYDIRAGECFTPGCGEDAYRSVKVGDHFEPRCMKCYYKTEKKPSLVVVIGPMFSQKTLELIAKVKEKERKLKLNPIKNYKDEFMNKDLSAIFKWSKDKRYGLEKIVSHDGGSIDAIPVDNTSQVKSYLQKNKHIGFVGFDEIQFFKGAYPLINWLLEKGYSVYAVGLDENFKGEGFGDVPKILTLADTIISKEAYCTRCQKKKKKKTQRFVTDTINGIKKPAKYDDPIVLVAGKDSYTSACRSCHWVPGKPLNKYDNILKLKKIN